MQVQFTEESFKEHTKMMLDYLKKQGFDVPLCKGMEAASRFCGAKSWNVLSAAFKSEEKQEEQSRLLPTYMIGALRVKASVKAAFHTDDYSYEFDFDATTFLKNVDFDTLRMLMLENWGHCQEADEIARYYEESNESLNDALRYTRRSQGHDNACGFEVQLDELEVLKYLRAFRYDDYVRLMLVDDCMLESLEDVQGWVLNGYGVVPEFDGKSHAARWRHVMKGVKSESWSSNEKLAWEELGKKLEQEQRFSFTGLEITCVVPNSGRWE